MIPPEINYLLYFLKKEVKQFFWVIDVRQATALVVYTFFLQCMQLPTHPIPIDIIFLPKLELFKAIRK